MRRAAQRIIACVVAGGWLVQPLAHAQSLVSSNDTPLVDRAVAMDATADILQQRPRPLRLAMAPSAAASPAAPIQRSNVVPWRGAAPPRASAPPAKDLAATRAAAMETALVNSHHRHARIRSVVNQLLVEQPAYHAPPSAAPAEVALTPASQAARERTADEAMQRALQQARQAGNPAGPPPPVPPTRSSSVGPTPIPDQTTGASTQPPVSDEWVSPIQPLNDRLAPVKLSGFYRMAAGFTRDEVILQRANGNLSERDFRILSGNLHENTFDPQIYSRFRLIVDTTRAEGWNAHANITVDPWSFRGRSHRITVAGTGGDTVEVEYKFWSNTGRTLNEVFPTLQNGDSFATPEVKLTEGRTSPTTVTSTFGNTFNIPEIEVHQFFQPLRELWADYKSDQAALRIFPMALQDQAVTSDDPLQLSNHHIYWEPSPWIYQWKPGRLNPGAAPDDFTPGAWSDSLAFVSRDSDLDRLTALRGTRFALTPSDWTQWTGAIAAPMGLWDDYGRWDGWVGMGRLRQNLTDRLLVGGTYTTRWAYDERRLDAYNHVFSVDTKYRPNDYVTLAGQVATSRSQENLESGNYNIHERGHAIHGSIAFQFPIGDVRPESGGGGSDEGEEEEAKKAEGTRLRFAFTHMDRGFDPGLANYHQTRRDQFWGRHIHFRQPFAFYRGQPATRYKDIDPFRIGDGIDVGRDAWSVRLEGSYLEERYKPLIDLRNVHDVNGKILETIIRHEATVELAKQWTGKYLFIRQQMPRTTGNIDPFLYTADGTPYNNARIASGRDPSLTLYSTGLQYRPMTWLSLYGIYERTNDINELGSGHYPRGLLNDASVRIVSLEDRLFRQTLPFLYNQEFFPLPPYTFFHIFRTGLKFQVYENMEFNAEWTRNEWESAGQIDDNINHWGVDLAWAPKKKHLFLAKYTRSYMADIAQEIAGGGYHIRHHSNMFLEWVYQINPGCELSVQFGEAAIDPPVTTTTFSPFGGYLPTVDTEHLVRIYLTGKF